MNSSNPYGARSTADDVLSGVNLAGKTILVTGCNSGLGLETIKVLSAHGARIIGLARSLDSAQKACANAGASATPVACDLSDLASVSIAIDTIRRLGTPLDAIVTNAGIAAPSKLDVRYGVELQFLVNHISHFYLVTRLIDLVPDQTGRVVIGSSSSSTDQAPKEGILFDNLDGHRYYKPFTFYGQSKLATALFAKELSSRLAGRGIAVNSYHPGATRGTNLNVNLSLPLRLVLQVAQLFMKSVPQGAATQTMLAASPLIQGTTGEYWSDCHVAKGSKFLADQALATRLWNVSEQLISEHSRGAARC